MVKKVYKYGTGDNVPEGAFYLTTLVETKSEAIKEKSKIKINTQRLVWHYFLVEIK